MEAFVKMLASAWPGMLLVSGIIGSLFAWFITRDTRKKTADAQARMVAVYEATIAAKDRLATSVAEAKLESDARHETAIQEYRSTLHTVRNQLQARTDELAEAREKLADLNARTDFAPVLEFQQSWYKESQTIHRQMLETMQIIAPVLREVSEALREFKRQTQDVHIVGTDKDPVHTRRADGTG